jgi:hypothetical protein
MNASNLCNTTLKTSIRSSCFNSCFLIIFTPKATFILID